MAKLTLNPKTGLSKNETVSFRLEGIPEGATRIRIENATHQIPLSINGNEYLDFEIGVSSVEGLFKMDMPEYASDDVIAVFAQVENEDGALGIYGATYSLIEEGETFEGVISVEPAFISPNDRVRISVDHKPNQDLTISINDKRFIVKTDDSGEGSISVYGKDFKPAAFAPVVQRYPVLAYEQDDNFKSAKKTGSNVHILPDAISLHASTACDPDDAEAACRAQSRVDPPTLTTDLDGVLTPSGQSSKPVSSNLQVSEKSTENLISGSDITRVVDNDVTLLPNGTSIHGVIGHNNDKNDAGECIGPVAYLFTDSTSLDREADPIRYGAVEPGTGITLYVPQAVFDQVTADLLIGTLIGLMQPEFNFDHYRVKEKIEPDEYVDQYRLVLESDNIEVEDWNLCVPYIVFSDTDGAPAVNLISPFELPSMTDVIGEPATPTSISVAASNSKAYSDGTSFVYVVVAAVANGISNLYYYAINTSSPVQAYGWTQMTFKGTNKNPQATVDDTGTLHVIWESTRSNASQIYYGALGPAAASASNAALSSALDKQAEVLQKDANDQSWLSTSEPLMFEIADPNSIQIVKGTDEYAANTAWLMNPRGESVVDVISNAEMKISGNAGKEQALAWTIVDKDESNADFTSTFDQRQFEVSFRVTDNFDGNVRTDDDINDLFETWKSPYSSSSGDTFKNQPIYTLSENSFILGRTSRYYDRMIPIFGSYRQDSLEERFQNASMEAVFKFKAVVSDVNSNVNHFMIGLMPEKVRFVATNTQTFQDFCAETGKSTNDSDCADAYLGDSEEIYLTGRYKLMVVIAADNSYFGGSALPKYALTRQVSRPFTLNGPGAKIQLFSHYKRMTSEDAFGWVGFDGVQAGDTDAETRFIASLNIAINEQIEFSESYLANLCNGLTDFHLAFGWPADGHYVSNDPQPHESSSFDWQSVNLNFEDISIGSPSFVLDPNLVTMPDEFRGDSMSVEPSVQEGGNSCIPARFEDSYGFLTLGIDDLGFPQIPVTFEGVNQSPSIAKTPHCEDIHIAWESNR